MDEITILLVVLFIVLAIVTVVGHGIWVLLARIFGGPRRPPPPSQFSGDDRDYTARPCPRCQTPLARSQQVCTVCNWPRAHQTPADGMAALRAIHRQLELFGQQGALDTEARDQLNAVINDQERRLTEQLSILAKQAAATDAAAVASTAPTEEVVAPGTAAPAAASELAADGEPASTSDAAAAPHAVEPLPERARKYAASRAAAMDEVRAEPAAPVEPPKQREALSRLFAAFMEEKNIRWGELVGGLLIVGCSIALVISFWSQIAAQPLLKFVLFNGVTAALFGVGMYTDRRWKIHTTSHGLLAIATLLVPLNFLAIAAFTQASPPTDVLSLAGEGLSLAAFALLTYFAGRILVPDEPVLLAIGVLVPCLMQLLVRRFAEPTTPLLHLYALAAAPIATYMFTTGIVTRKRWSSQLHHEEGQGDGESPTAVPTPSAALPETEANRVLLFLGLTSAAAVMPMALLLHNVPPILQTLHWLAPLVALFSLPALLTGLLFWRRLTDRAHSNLQTAGIAVGVLGALIMIGAVVVAWPTPAVLMPTALAAAAAMLIVALIFNIPAAHVPAGVAITAAWLIAFYVWRGSIGWMLDDSTALCNTLLSATTGHVLAPLVAAFGGLTVWLHRASKREASRMYALVAAAAAIVSLALLFWFGFARHGDPANVTWTLALYALAAFAAALVTHRTDAAYVASALLLAALGQGIVYRYDPSWQLAQPWIVALLAHASIVAVACSVLQILSVKVLRAYVFTVARRVEVLRVLTYSALLTSVVAAAWLAATCYDSSAATLGVRLAWLGLVWLILAVLHESPALVTASQVGFVLAIICGVTAAVESRPWYAASPHPWLDPWFLETQGIALAAYCLMRSAIRWLIGQELTNDDGDVLAPEPPHWIVATARLIQPPWPGVDQFVSIALVALMVIVAVYAVLPGAAQELSPTEVVGQRVVSPVAQFEIAAIPHAHAADRGAWLLLFAVAIALAARIAYQIPHWRRIGLVALAMVMCLLVAARFESQVAVASALRWLAAGLLAAASAVAWFLDRNKTATPMVGGVSDADPSSAKSSNGRFIWTTPTTLRDSLVAFNALIYVAMAAYVAQAALMRSSTLGTAVPSFLWISTTYWLICAGVVAALMFVSAAGSGRDFNQFADLAPIGRVARQMRWVTLLSAIAPIAIVLMFTVAKVLSAQPLVGPDYASWFRRMGFEALYGVPLVLIALTFTYYAIRDRASQFAFAAGLLFNLVATFVFLLWLARKQGTLDATAWISVAQINAVVAGIVALVWRVGESLRDSQRFPRAVDLGATEVASDRSPPRLPLLLVTQVALTAVLCGSFLIPCVVRVATQWSPLVSVSPWVAVGGSPLGWCAVILAIAAAFSLAWRNRVSQLVVATIVAAIIGMVALTALHQGHPDSAAYHVLLIGFAVAAWITPSATTFLNQLFNGSPTTAVNNAWSAIPVRAFDIATAGLALWEYTSVASWWIVIALVAIGLRNIIIAWQEGRRGSMWFAAVLLLFATSTWWLDLLKKNTWQRGPGDFFDFLWMNVFTAAALAVISVWIERRHSLSETQTAAARWRSGIAFHRFVAWAIVAVLLFTSGAGLIADLMNDSFPVNPWMAWGAWAAAAIVAGACLWDSTIRWPVPCLYCVGLVAVGMYLDGLDLRTPLFQWALANALASYSLATSALWSVRDRLRGTLASLGVPVSVSLASRRDATTGSRLPETATSAVAPPTRTFAGEGHGWLVTVNILVGFLVLLLVTLIELTMPNAAHRMVAAYGIGAQSFAIGLLARGAVRTSLQYLSLVWGVLFAVAFGWAWVPPDFAAPWLHRLVVTAAALAAVLVLYGFGLVKFLKRENEWTRAAAKLVPSLAVLAVVLVLAVLGIEVRGYARDGSVPIATPALVAVIVALAGLMIAALVAALVPGRDPLGLSERGRTLYVYLAEVLGALLFVHIRVTMPWLFAGWFLRFWPLVVMAIAFVGVGVGELFRRRKQNVLSEPLENTGAILPLLPALGYWVRSNDVDYSLLLLSIGVLYAGLSILRRSFAYGVLAAVAANGSLWYLLHRWEGLDFLEHPQLWLIPPALCALAAGYINRERLTAQQSSALRYAAAIVIYVSSTADIFINGVAEAPWLPGVLAGISVFGVLMGILLRVRAFLYLGTAFLVIAIMTIIWHAAEGHTWVWWIAGIVTGVLIIALFGIFEKRRDDVLRVVEELKHWQA